MRAVDTLREHREMLYDVVSAALTNLWDRREFDPSLYNVDLADQLAEDVVDRLLNDGILAALLDAAPDREALLAGHLPVVNRDGRVVGCRCSDDVFAGGAVVDELLYAEHLADVLASADAPLTRPAPVADREALAAAWQEGWTASFVQGGKASHGANPYRAALLAGTVPAPVADREAAKRVAAVLDARGEIGENLCTVHIGRNKWLHLTVTDVRALLADGSTAEANATNSGQGVSPITPDATAEPDAATVKRAADAIGEALNGLPFLDAQEESNGAARMVLARAALRAALAEGGSE